MHYHSVSKNPIYKKPVRITKVRELAPIPYFFYLKHLSCRCQYVCKVDEFPAISKQNVTDAHMHAHVDSMKTVYPTQTQFGVGGVWQVHVVL